MGVITVVAWDAGPGAERALDWAARRESRGGRALRVLRVLPASGAYSPGPTSALDLVAARRRVHHRLDHLRAAYPGLEVTGGVACGDVVDEIRLAVAEGTLLVLGQDADHPSEPRSRRRVAARLSALVAGPVVVVPSSYDADARSDHDPADVVVGVDGTHASLDALRFGAEQARESGSRILAVHVWSGPAHWDDIFVDSHALEVLVTHQHAQLLEESIELGLAAYPDVHVVRRVVRGDASTELRRLAGGAALLVVGEHGRGPLARHLLGSVSSSLVIDPVVPTVIVHDPSSVGREADARSRSRVRA